MSDYLPQKVLTEILSRLPVPSLLRFRCVCKSWLSLISTPDFISKHSSLSTTKTTTAFLLLRRYSHRRERFSLHLDAQQTFPKLRDLKYPFPTRLQYYFRILGSCNGLVCLTDDSFGNTNTNTIILWNPSIQKSLTLPLPKSTRDLDGSFFMCALGFGFDSMSNDYKVVRVSYSGGEDGFWVPPNVEIYAVCVNGNVHWVGYKRVSPVTRGCFVVVFDLGGEVFGEVELPGSLVHEFPSNMMVSVMDECLSVLVYDKRAYSKQCTVWVMKEYGVAESWSKQYEIDLDGRLVLVLGLRKNGEMLLVMGKELVSYNPESEGIKKLGVSGCKDSFWFGDYTESLVLLGGADSVNGEAEPSVSDEADGLEDDAVGLRAYYMQTIMLNAPDACL
ncbi:hypothetical protein RHMOL_Rhmol06G0173400 [Rhododendron molle]|uniref:Uncharacterized protein n=1 Tax=Rhododendron molle TaxID=49168 RepID=A0ACC0ND61_RHOML|nr:hypothetical protein RHMOL_Rhmol06G0173400 [Rhododendron molle]